VPTNINLRSGSGWPVGKRIGEMYRGDGFHAFGFDCRCDRSSPYREIVVGMAIYLSALQNLAIDRFPWYMVLGRNRRVVYMCKCSSNIIKCRPLGMMPLKHSRNRSRSTKACTGLTKPSPSIMPLVRFTIRHSNSCSTNCVKYCTTCVMS